jgi:valyl-tRNA synthetase
MVNWDPQSQTALSDEEVIFKEVDSKLYYVVYKLANDPSGIGITVATTRPETILGDIAICVNPNDERYQNLIGKEVIVPLINRKIPIIADDYVTADFGTGALKVTPAHDKNDHLLGLKHQLKVINTLDIEGKFTTEDLLEENPSDLILSYKGVDRFALRKKIVEDIQQQGLIEKIEAYKGQVGTSERTGAVIEHRLSLQWFIGMEQFLKKNPQSLSAVMDDTIQFHPAKAKNTYSHWLSNIKDWCISRQLWWGQRIPAWYDEKGNVYVAESLEQLHQRNPETKDLVLTQDEDVLDTWFSSWLWPMEVFKGISHPGNKEASYYYPSTTLVTGQDIIFFWVARMIMAGYEFENKPPFKDVYFTGMVRDKLGRKMSKQLGNSPDLLALIEQYGADAVRFGIMVSSPAGNDLMFDEAALEQGRNFNNKLWNALKLVKMWESRVSKDTENNSHSFAIDWFNNRMSQVKSEVAILLKQFRLSEALKTIYSLIWDDFCSWYLEWVKPGFEQPVAEEVYQHTVSFFEEMMKLLHPFTPFITEEIYHLLKTQTVDLCITQASSFQEPNGKILAQGSLLKNVISSLRDARNKNQLKPKESIELYIQTVSAETYQGIENILCKQINASSIHFTNELVANSIVVAVEKDKFYIQSEKQLDSATLKDDLLKDLQHQQGFLLSVQKKLSNERFVSNARPEVIELERKKQADAEDRIRTIQESLAGLG